MGIAGCSSYWPTLRERELTRQYRMEMRLRLLLLLGALVGLMLRAAAAEVPTTGGQQRVQDEPSKCRDEWGLLSVRARGSGWGFRIVCYVCRWRRAESYVWSVVLTILTKPGGGGDEMYGVRVSNVSCFFFV